ncbi:hypothetical protein [Methanosarcina sp. UBA5]|uniref:hypothetical protein n=1 Tax=Methanosarcina sp. UBA5 TaxID=1915593 RepID=UPI0025EA2793|nr:hypothetical protein [Methanosarcina sp. UBA5]
MGISLESTESLTDAFAAKLKTTSYILYSIFIFISLALVALLPSVTLVGMKPEIVYLIFLYDLIFSALAALYSGYIFMRRPVAFTPYKYRIPILTLLISSRRNALLDSFSSGVLPYSPYSIFPTEVRKSWRSSRTAPWKDIFRLLSRLFWA